MVERWQHSLVRGSRWFCSSRIGHVEFFQGDLFVGWRILDPILQNNNSLLGKLLIARLINFEMDPVWWRHAFTQLVIHDNLYWFFFMHSFTTSKFFQFRTKASVGRQRHSWHVCGSALALNALPFSTLHTKQRFGCRLKLSVVERVEKGIDTTIAKHGDYSEVIERSLDWRRHFEFVQ